MVVKLLPPSVRSSLTEKRRNWDDAGYGYMTAFDGFAFTGAPPADVAAALAIVDERMRPIASDVLKVELARLRSAIQSRAIDLPDLQMKFQVIGDACAAWPADIVRASLRGWSRRENWWPTEAEVREELHRHGQRAAALAEALRHPQPPRPAPPREMSREDQRREDAAAEVQILAGFGHAFSPEQIMVASHSWTSFAGCSWPIWGFSYRRGQPWAVALLQRLVELFETDPTPPPEAIRQVVEAGFAERGDVS